MHRNIRLLKWFNFFQDFRPYAPVAIIYFAIITDSYALALAVYSISSITTAAFEVPTGIFSDFLGRRRTMIVGSLLSTLSIVCVAVAHSFEVLAVAAIFEGLAQAFFSGNNKAFLYDTLREANKEHELSDWLGKTGVMFQFGLGISAVLGGFIAEESLSLVMWVSVIPQFLTFILALRMREPAVHGGEESGNVFSHLGEAFRRFKENYQLRMLSIASVIDSALEEAMYQFYPAFFQMFLPTWAIGIVRAFSNATSATGYWFAGKLIRRFNAFRLLIGGELFMRVIGIFSVLFPSIISPFLLSFDVVHGTRMVAQDTLIQERFTDKQRATMGSLNSLAGAILFAVVAYGIGYVADVYSPMHAILAAQAALFIVIFFYWKAYRGNKHAGFRHSTAR